MESERGTRSVPAGDESLSAELQRELRQPLLSAREERRLALRATQDDAAARRRLVEANVRLVVAVAVAHRGRGVAHSDLVQEGMIGLLRAVERFDSDRGVRLATYAMWWIRRSMLAAIAAAPAIRLPVEGRRNLARILNTERELAGPGRPRPHPGVVAARSGLPVSRVERLRAAPHVVASLDERLADGQATFADVIADPTGSEMTSELDREEARLALHAALTRLAPRVRRLLTLRYGLDGGPQRSHQQIGRTLGMTAERSRQIEIEALRRLRPLAERASLAA